jgi:hypothetical protein
MDDICYFRYFNHQKALQLHKKLINDLILYCKIIEASMLLMTSIG